MSRAAPGACPDRRESAGARIEAVAGARVRVAGRWRLDFASSNYLGLARHPAVVAALARATCRWGVSLAAPRALAEDPFVAPLERALAALVGQDDALVFASTTHAAPDVLTALAGPGGAILADAWAYPLSVAGATLAAGRGAQLARFPHDDLAALERLLRRHTAAPTRTIVCDGVYPATGRVAPLAAFTRLAHEHRAMLYVDDANGIGLFGAGPTPARRWGRGGGGTPRWCGVPPGRLVHVGSLAKAFGVPLAFAAGPRSLIAHLRATAPILEHSSPPAVPIAAAALAAVRLHARHGDTLRARLLERIRHFRTGLDHLGFPALTGQPHPVQSARFPTAPQATTAYRALRRAGLRPVLQRNPPDAPGGGALRFVVTVEHELGDLDAALDALACVAPHPCAE